MLDIRPFFQCAAPTVFMPAETLASARAVGAVHPLQRGTRNKQGYPRFAYHVAREVEVYGIAPIWQFRPLRFKQFQTSARVSQATTTKITPREVSAAANPPCLAEQSTGAIPDWC